MTGPINLEQVSRVAPVDYQAFADAMSQTERRTVARQLESAVIGLTRLAVYLDYRSDTTHERAVDASNNTVNTVRKALGYTYDLKPLSY